MLNLGISTPPKTVRPLHNAICTMDARYTPHTSYLCSDHDKKPGYSTIHADSHGLEGERLMWKFCIRRHDECFLLQQLEVFESIGLPKCDIT